MPAKGGGGDGNATLLPGGGKLSELKGRVPSIPGMSTDEVNELFETFKMFDKDGDETIDAEELGCALRTLGQNPSKTEVAKMIADLDKDGSGSIDFEEFAKMMGQKSSQTSESELKDAFKFFDTEKTGVITEHELRHTLMQLGLDITPDQLEEMIEAADADGSGEITYEDFVELWGSGGD